MLYLQNVNFPWEHDLKSLLVAFSSETVASVTLWSFSGMRYRATVICSSSMRWQLSTKITQVNTLICLSESQLGGNSGAFNLRISSSFFFLFYCRLDD